MLKSLLITFTLLFSIQGVTATLPNQYDSMMKAIDNNDIKVVELLIRKNIDLKMRVDSRASPTFMTHSAFLGRTKILKILLDAGADIESLNGDARTSLMMAASGEHLETVNFLLSRGANVNATDRWGESVYDIVRGNSKIFKLLPIKS